MADRSARMLSRSPRQLAWRITATAALLLALVVGGLVALRSSAEADPGEQPVLPDLVSDRPEDPAIYVDDSGSGEPALLLRFDGYIHNAGLGELEVVGHRSRWEDEMQVNQLLYPAGRSGRDDWIEDPSINARIAYDRGDGHDHFHLDKISRYSLWNATRTAEAAPSMKIGFCLTDSRRVETHGPAIRRWDADRIAPCNVGDYRDLVVREGLSPGWRDWYRAGIAYQWVDISAVRPGSYWLRTDIDPDRYVIESNEVNPPAYAVAPTLVPGYNALAGNATTDEDVPVSVRLPSERWGAPVAGQPTFAIVDPPDHGRLGAVAGGNVQYTPDAGYHGPDSFTFTARDGGSGYPTAHAQATVLLQVNDTPDPSVVINGAPSSLQTGASVQLTAAVVDDDPAVTWRASAGSISANGLLTAPASVPVGGAVDVVATTRLGARAQVSIPIVARPVPSVSISGAPPTLLAGTGVQLSANVVNDAPEVTWSASAGSITPGGLFTAPDPPPAGGTVDVVVTTSLGARAQVTIAIDPRHVSPPSVSINGAPSSLQTGASAQLSATVLNDDPAVTWRTSAGSISAGGLLTAPSTVPAGGAVEVVATTRLGARAQASITVEARPVPSVSILGAPPSLIAGTGVQLTANVVDDRPGVTWSASAGSITPAGLFTAPDQPPAGGTVDVVATSAAGARAQVTIAIAPKPTQPTIAISGAPATLLAGTSVQLSAAIVDDLPSVSWSASAGTITPDGLYIAPATVAAPIAVQVTASSARASDTRTIEIQPPPVVVPRPDPHLQMGHEGDHHEHGDGTDERTAPKRKLSSVSVARVGQQLVMAVTPGRQGRARIEAWHGRRKLGTCVARVLPGRRFTCRVKLPRGLSARAKIRIVAGLRSGKTLTRVERKPAAIARTHAH